MVDDIQLWKMPPIVKVYEAIGALGDRRVQIKDRRHAEVVSSDGSKTYHVETSDDGREISSNDNASYWQGYLGYPAIAVLLMRGLLQYEPAVAKSLGGIPWKELNRRFHNDYTRTLAEVERTIAERGGDPARVAAGCAVLLE